MIQGRTPGEPEYPESDEPIDDSRSHTLKLTGIPDNATIVTTEFVSGGSLHVLVTVRNAFPIDPQPFGAGVHEKFDVEVPRSFNPRNN